MTAADSRAVSVDNVTVKAYRDTTGDGMPNVWVTEHVEDFALADHNYAHETLKHDAAGNLTYDGVFAYAYDAWNRLVKVNKAWRDGQGAVQAGALMVEMRYDGRGRRIMKAVRNAADLNFTYRCYYDGDSVVEVQDGSHYPTMQYVSGLMYIDELVQVGHNDLVDAWPDYQNDKMEVFFWAMQDSNFNVLGIVDNQGVLRERRSAGPGGTARPP